MGLGGCSKGWKIFDRGGEAVARMGRAVAGLRGYRKNGEAGGELAGGKLS